MRLAHLVPVAVVVALAVSATTCRLDKLINPATVDRFTVSPSTIATTAHVGSDIDSVTLRLATGDGGARSWTATPSAVWLELSDSAGTTPDSVIVLINPDTLSETLHEDTIVFVSAATGETIRVPVAVSVLPPAPELSVVPASRAETAFVGSGAPDTFSLLIDNTGALPLTWSAVVDSSWIAISKDTGSAPPAQTSLVTLTSGTLPAGTHTGAITVTATPSGTIGSPKTVPVSYTIKPCDEPTITLDAVVTGSIALSDCGAPQRAGRQAKLYAVQATAGDTLSFRLTAAFNAYLVLTNKTGVAVLDENDQCAPSSTACLLNFIVSSTDRYLVEVTTTNPGETGAFTLTAVKERSPSPPGGILQLRGDSTTAIGIGAISPDSVAVFRGTVNDGNPGDSVRLEIELWETSSPFSGTSNHQSAYVGVGQTAWIRVPGLVENAAYHWRVRACDATLRCSAWVDFGNPDPAVDFYVNAVPEAPPVPTSIGQFTSGGAPIAVGNSAGGSSVILSGTVSDPDPGDQVRLEVEVLTVPLSGNNFANTATAVSPFGASNRVASATGPATVLFSYHWQVRTCDQTGRCSAWVSFPQPTPNPETSADYVGSL